MFLYYISKTVSNLQIRQQGSLKHLSVPQAFILLIFLIRYVVTYVTGCYRLTPQLTECSFLLFNAARITLRKDMSAKFPICMGSKTISSHQYIVYLKLIINRITDLYSLENITVIPNIQ